MKRTFWIYFLPVSLLLAVTLPHLDQGDFRAETAHYGAIGLQAWRSPDLFWTPHEHPAVRYFNKPPLVFWIHGFFLHRFGVSLMSARIPSILAAVGCVLFTIAIARRLMGRATALAAGCILALSYEFFRRTREISLDMWQLVFILAAVWIWAMAAQNQRRGLAWVAGIPLGLALMCKPLMALLILPILCFWRPGTTRQYTWVARMGLTALLVALPWHLSMAYLHGEAFSRQYFGHEVMARMQGLRNREPVWYYLVEIGRSYWPWMVVLIAGLLRWRHRTPSSNHRKALFAATLWTLVWFAALSLFPDKRPRYELPLYPMMALIAGYGAVTLPWRGLRRWYRRGMGITALIVTGVCFTTNLIPLKIQDPPDKPLAALGQWFSQQDPTIVYSASVTPSDESALYLKTGNWPKPLPPRHHLSPGCLLIYTDGLPLAPTPDETVVFRNGPYRATVMGHAIMR